MRTPAHLEGRTAPPVFAHVPVMQSMVETIGLATDAAPLHGEHDFHFHRPIAPDCASSPVDPPGDPAEQGGRAADRALRHPGRRRPGDRRAVLDLPGAGRDDRRRSGTLRRRARSLPKAGDRADGVRADRRCVPPLRRCGARDYSPYTMLPEAARAMGFPAPILHGMCTLGYASRVVVDQGCGGDSRRLKRWAGASPIRCS